MAEDLEQLVTSLARHAKQAARTLAAAETTRKNMVLLRAAAALRGPEGDAVLAANEQDLADGRANGLSRALLDRLELTRSRLDAVAEGVETIAALPDPVGELLDPRRLPNGLETSRMRVPLGLIGIVYESRPNVTADAAALCIKSGNAVLLRGGSEAYRSNRAIADIFGSALEAEGLPRECAALLPTTDREATSIMIRLDGVLDVVIPRGGAELIHFVAENARVPVIRHGKGVCHVFVEREADLEMATRIVINSKTQRPGVCNAAETLLVDATIAAAFLPALGAAMAQRGVRLHADERSLPLLGAAAVAASPGSWDTEYLALELNVAVVDDLDAAIAHVARHGSHHTESIVTRNADKGRRWVREVDASLVLVNASTRFNDGHQLGLGAELGISTTKLHAYGPMGLNELCTTKWVGYGTGQVRQ
ncbi:MAG: glutamate-5-semialdehyde dehydrogenase [Sandaracinaceae bacterium]|nr:glutamate-5-semialdehyde dehydrogenase [Sandaracinaceae bacterium]